ncbi:organic cation transporter protein [Bombyx mori]|uniref:Major facilitator superfamily (MFS) profile domain-containing protein n=1 Tax=Bombyx mori TaxID=7091 RepID=A0A8R2HR33_BOMMO|nr:organic cation transporter protein [Bombyx mori]XP_037868990.1 organic cation transporter protein [Bombyx mori]
MKMKNVFKINKKYTVNISRDEKEICEDDYIVKSIGECGLFQISVCSIVTMTRFIGIWNCLSVLFLIPAQSFRCIHFKENGTIHPENFTCYSDCIEYEYSQEIFEETVISKFNLICDRAWLANFTQTALMFGVLAGVSTFCWMSDRFGRGKAIFLAGLTNIAFMIAIIFSTNYFMFLCFRFGIGVGSGGFLGLSSIIIAETVGASYREMGVSLGLVPDGFAQASLAAFAYYSSTWKMYLFGFTVVSILIVVLLFFVPESPRWLVANGKSDAAIEVLTKAAKINKRSPTEIESIVTQRISEIKINESDAQHHTYFDLFRTKELAVITVSSIISLFVSGISFFGINEYISRLGSSLNIYLIVMIMGLGVIPTVPMSMVIAKTCNRRSSSAISLLITAIAMGLLIFVPADTWYSILLGVIAVAASCVTFSIQFTFVTELYPTSMRSMGFGLSAGATKLGAMMAPFVASSKPFWMAPLIFCILPIIAIVFTLILPETKGKKLKDTLNE